MSDIFEIIEPSRSESRNILINGESLEIKTLVPLKQ